MKAKLKLALCAICFLLLGFGTFVTPINAYEVTVQLKDINSATTLPPGNFRWLDVANQPFSQFFFENYDYTQADVTVTYEIVEGIFQGTLMAFNLKPNFAYPFINKRKGGQHEHEMYKNIRFWCCRGGVPFESCNGERGLGNNHHLPGGHRFRADLYMDYSFQVELDPGVHFIGVSFLNDAWNPGVEDRNLYVDRFAIISPPGIDKPEL